MERRWMSTRQCADIIGGVGSAYIRGEIAAGRLHAEVIPRPPSRGCREGRAAIRIYPDEFRAYLDQYWPRVQWQPAA